MSRQSNIFSKEASDIIGTPPRWIIRWGISIFFALFFGTLVGCYFIKYPKTIKAPITISSFNPPIDLMARKEGLIDTFYVVNESFVRQGEVILKLSSTADYEAVALLEKRLNTLRDKSFVYEEWINHNYEIGEIQAVFCEFQNLCLDYRSYLESDILGGKLQMLEKQLSHNKEYLQWLGLHKQIKDSVYFYQYRNFHRDSLLFVGRMITPLEYENSLRSLLEMKSTLISNETEMASARLSGMQTEQQLDELILEKRKTISEYERSINQSCQNVLNSIQLWKEQYLIIAPIDGQVSYVNYWHSNQWVKTGERLISMVPKDNCKVIGRLQIPINNIGSVTKGQIVITRLDTYPYLEYGMIQGVISNISAVPNENNQFIAEVHYSNGLLTSRHIELPLIQQITGEGRVVTKEMRLLEYLWQK